MQHSDPSPAMARHARTLWQITAGFGTGRLGPLALHLAEDRHIACQVAIRSGGLTAAQIDAVDFGRLGKVIRGFFKRRDGDRFGHSPAHGRDAIYDMGHNHDEP